MFEPSQPLGIISGLKKTFIKRYIVERTNKTVSWCFELNQPLGITSGLKKTFIKRYIVERTNKTVS